MRIPEVCIESPRTNYLAQARRKEKREREKGGGFSLGAGNRRLAFPDNQGLI